LKNIDTMDTILGSGLIAILRGLDEESTVEVAKALYSAGVKAIEITYNTPNASHLIRKLTKMFDGCAAIGAGTVLNMATAVEAIESGADFILAPNLNLEVIKTTKSYSKISIPGAFTPSEIVTAINAGADIVKIFPASSVGIQYIKDLKGPLNDIPMMPVGGVDIDNVGDFIRAGSCAVGVGSNLIKKSYVEKQEYSKITELAIDFLNEIKKVR